MIFQDKILLITGGTGSFGNAVLQRLLGVGLKEIRIFSRDEKKQDDMRQEYKSSKIKFYIGDVRDPSSIESAIKNVDFIFHAAALKQVPSCEFFPLEAVKTNVIGADNIIRSAINNNVQKVVVLSTDKAVYPINAMGLTKALMEKVMVANSRNSFPSVLCGTRYGNVMGSRGSVIPLFISQIKSGKPITITDPNMTRFMMTLEDAVDLVLYAFEYGNSGDIFVQKSPACTIHILAKALLEIYGGKGEIKIIGTRHGEKVHETLVNREEMVKSKDLGNYYCISSDSRDLNYDRYLVEGEHDLTIVEEYNSHNTHQLDVKQMMQHLLKLDFIQADMKIH